MLAEFVNKITQLAHEAAEPFIVHPEAEPGHVYIVATRNGIEVKRAEPPPRAHTAGSLEALAGFVNDFNDEARPGVVWYSRAGVTALLDNSDRRDKVTLPLALSPQLQTLFALEKLVQWKKQADFLRLLRVGLHNCLAPAGNILDIVRQLRWQAGSDATGKLAHGKASLGKVIEHQVTGQGAIPEEVALDVPVFHNLQMPSQRVLCALELDVPNEALALVPLPGELEKAVQAAEARVGEKLAELLPGVLVLYGCA